MDKLILILVVCLLILFFFFSFAQVNNEQEAKEANHYLGKKGYFKAVKILN